MSCNRQHVAAAVCGFVHEVTGEKVTQSDWHGLVARAKNEGYDTGRARLDIGMTRTDFRALGVAEGNLDAAESALAELGWKDTPGNLVELSSGANGKLPSYTKNMEAVVRMMTQQGVKESLDAVRAARKTSDPFPISDQQIQQRMSERLGTLGPDFKPYDFTVTGPDIAVSDMVWARSSQEARRTVDEWAIRFRNQSVFTTEVRKAELGTDVQGWTGGALPRLAQDMSEEQVEDVVVWLSEQPMTDLRQRRDIHEEQWLRAYDMGQTDVANSEARKADMTSDAIWRKETGIPLMGRHNTRAQWEARYGDSDS